MGSALGERRAWQRYLLDWPVRVAVMDPTGNLPDEVGFLENLSPMGAFARLENPIPVGAKVDVSIQLPLQANIWMQFSGEAIRVEKDLSNTGVALIFYSARPRFIRF